MRFFLILLTASFLAQKNVIAQTAEDSIKATIIDLFKGMKNADSALLKSAFSNNAILQTITRDKAGGLAVATEGLEEFAGFVANVKKDSADERIEFETIRVDGPLAIAWTPYEFYFNGVFSHCGVNSFQLVRFQGKWKIQYLIDTRRKQGCK